MTIALVALVVAVLGFHAYQTKQWANERALMVKAIIARSPGEFIAMNLEPRARKPKPAEPEIEQVGI